MKTIAGNIAWNHTGIIQELLSGLEIVPLQIPEATRAPTGLKILLVACCQRIGGKDIPEDIVEADDNTTIFWV